MRATELGLLSLALAVSVGAGLLVDVATTPAGQPLQALSPAARYGAVLVVVAAAAHVVIRRFAPLADPMFLPLGLVLNGLGLALIHRLDIANDTDLALAQTVWTVAAVVLFAATLVVISDHRRLTGLRYTAGAAALGLLLLPLIPVLGYQVRGARLWIDLGVISFQPGELAKLAMVVFLAGYLADKRALLKVATTRLGPVLMPPLRHLAPVLLAALGGIGILVAQRDLGSSLLFLGVFVIMLYVATGRLAYPTVGLGVFAAGSWLAWTMFAHVQERFAIWLDPWAASRIRDESFQLVQSLFALGTGGVVGTGLGRGHPQIPAAATDAIFAVAGEELGLLGATALLVCYTLLVVRGYRVALTVGDEVGTLLAAGLATILGLQVFVIVAGITRLVPLTGITLPLVSYGGSSLVANWILLALLMRLSDTARRRARLGRGGAW